MTASILQSLFVPATADSVASPTLKSATETVSILHLWNITLYCEEEIVFIKFYFLSITLSLSLSLSLSFFYQVFLERIMCFLSLLSDKQILKKKLHFSYFAIALVIDLGDPRRFIYFNEQIDDFQSRLCCTVAASSFLCF